MVQCSLDVEIHYARLMKNKVIYYAIYIYLSKERKKNPLKVQNRTGFESSSHFFQTSPCQSVSLSPEPNSFKM